MHIIHLRFPSEGNLPSSRFEDRTAGCRYPEKYLPSVNGRMDILHLPHGGGGEVRPCRTAIVTTDCFSEIILS